MTNMDATVHSSGTSRVTTAVKIAELICPLSGKSVIAAPCRRCRSRLPNGGRRMSHGCGVRQDAHEQAAGDRVIALITPLLPRPSLAKPACDAGGPDPSFSGGFT